MPSLDVIKLVTIKSKVEGGPETVRGLNQIAGAQDGVARSSERVTASTTSTERAYDRLQRTYDREYRAHQEIIRVQRVLDLARNQGLSSIERENDLMTRAQTALGQTTKANDNFAKSAGLSSHALTNVGYQLQDIVASLGSGSSPFTVMMQQSGQLYSALSTGPGGLAGGLSGLAGTVRGMVTPFTVAGTAAATFGAAALYGFSQAIEGEKSLRASLDGLGRGTGATVDRLNSIAEASASAGRVSVSSAREMVAAFSSTGRIGVENFGGLIAAAKNYGATVGADLPEATKQLASAFADPLRGADTLNERLGFLTDHTRELIRVQVEQGNRSGAQRTLLEAMNPVLTSAEQRLTGVARAWDAIKRGADNAIESMGRSVSGASTAGERLAETTGRKRSLDESSSSRTPRARAASDFLGQKQALEQEDVRREQQLRDSQRREAEDRAASLKAGDLARSVIPGVEARDRMERERLQLEAAKPWASAKPNQIEDAKERLKQQLKTYEDPNQRARSEHQLNIDGLSARSPKEQERLAARRAELDLAGEALTANERAERVGQAAALARAQAEKQAADAMRERTRAMDQHVAGMQLEVRLTGLNAGETARLRFEHERLAAAQQEAARTNTSVSEVEIARIREKAREVERLTTVTAASRLTTEALFEREQLGRSEAEQRIASSLRSAGLTGTPEGDRAAEVIRLTDNLKEGRAVADEMFRGMLADLKAGKSFADSLNNSLGRMLDRLQDKALNGALNAAFNGLTGALSGSDTAGAAAARGASNPALFGPGFATGGYTGDGGRYDPAGIVHRGEFVVNAAVTRANRPLLEALNDNRRLPGFAEGGYVGPAPVAYVPPQASTAPAMMGGDVQIVNLTGQPVKEETVQGPRGPTKRVVVGDAVKGAFESGDLDRLKSQRFGLKRHG